MTKAMQAIELTHLHPSLGPMVSMVSNITTPQPLAYSFPVAISFVLVFPPFLPRKERGAGGGGDSHIKRGWVLVVSLRGVNFGF